MTDFTKQHFADTTITLDGNRFTHCTFVRCNLEFQGVAAFELSDNTITECRIGLAGPAAMTIKTLRTLYLAGWRDDVRSLCESITADPAPGSSSVN